MHEEKLKTENCQHNIRTLTANYDLKNHKKQNKFKNITNNNTITIQFFKNHCSYIVKQDIIKNVSGSEYKPVWDTRQNVAAPICSV